MSYAMNLEGGALYQKIRCGSYQDVNNDQGVDQERLRTAHHNVALL